MRLETKILANVLALGLTFAIVEGGVRLLAKVTHRERGMRFDPELGWRPMPGVHKIGQVWGVTRPAASNSLGWRDRERPLQKPTGRRRVVALGDSMTFGASADDGDRFTDVFEQVCGKAEILNLGVAGYGPDQELRLMEIEGFRYQPDLILVTISLVNDVDDVVHDVRYSWPKPYYRWEEGRLVVVRPHRSLGLTLRDASYLYELTVRLFRDVDLEDHVAPELTDIDALPLFRAVLTRMTDVAREHGVALAAVLAYTPGQIESGLSDKENRAREIVRALQIPVLDTSDLFAPAMKAGEQLFADDQIHWNASGHMVVAKALCDWPAIQRWLN